MQAVAEVQVVHAVEHAWQALVFMKYPGSHVEQAPILLQLRQ